MSNTQPSQLLKTAMSLIEAYQAWDLEAIMAPRAPNCTQQVFPARLNRAPRTNDEYRADFSLIHPHIKNYSMKVLETVVDEKDNKVVVHATNHAETPVGPSDNEYMFIIQMTTDRKQIESVKEFLDSGFSEGFYGRLFEYIKGGEKKA